MLASATATRSLQKMVEGFSPGAQEKRTSTTAPGKDVTSRAQAILGRWDGRGGHGAFLRLSSRLQGRSGRVARKVSAVAKS